MFFPAVCLFYFELWIIKESFGPRNKSNRQFEKLCLKYSGWGTEIFGTLRNSFLRIHFGLNNILLVNLSSRWETRYWIKSLWQLIQPTLKNFYGRFCAVFTCKVNLIFSHLSWETCMVCWFWLAWFCRQLKTAQKCP